MPEFIRTDRYPTDPLLGSRMLVYEESDQELRLEGTTLTVHKNGMRKEIGTQREPEPNRTTPAPLRGRRT